MLEWLHFQTFNAPQKSNRALIVDVPNSISNEALVEIVDTLVHRHEVLRTTFDADEKGDPIQSVWPTRRIVLHELHFATQEFDAGGVAGFTGEHFNIRLDWPIRAAVVERPEGRQLILVLPHIVIDATGFRILRRDLDALFKQYSRYPSDLLSDSRFQPIDLAYLDLSAQASRSRCKEFWDERVSRMPGGTFRVSTIPENVRYIKGSLRSSRAGRALEDCADRYKFPTNIIVLTAIAVNISALCGTTSIPVNLTWSSRVGTFASSVVGSIARDLMLPVDLRSDSRFFGMVHNVLAEFVESARHSNFDVLEFHESIALASRKRGTRIGSGIFVNCQYNSFRSQSQENSSNAASECSIRPDVHHVCVEYAEQMKSFIDEACVLGIGVQRSQEGDLEVHVNAVDAVFDPDLTSSLLEGIENTILRFAEDPDFEPNVHNHTDGTIAGQADRPGLTLLGDEWVDVDLMKDILLEHPHIMSAVVNIDGRSMTVEVGTSNPNIEARDIREIIYAKLDKRHAVKLPDNLVVRHQFVDSRFEHISTSENRVELLCEAVARANALISVSPLDSYIWGGGRLKYVPRVLSILASSNLNGLRPTDFLIPCNLESLALKLATG